MKKNKKGFTLIELMIVVAIIAIIAAIAIPSLLGARKSANEANAIGTLRTLSTCAEQFKTAYVNPATSLHEYLAALIELNDQTKAPTAYVDATLGAAIAAASAKNGYFYAWSNPTGVTLDYQCIAAPAAPGDTGDRFFRVSESGVLEEGPAAIGPWTPVSG